MTTGSLTQLLLAIAGVLSGVAAILHSVQTRRIVHRRLPARHSAVPDVPAQRLPGIDQNGLPGESGVYPPYQPR